MSESPPGAESSSNDVGPYVLLLGDFLYNIEMFSAIDRAVKSIGLRVELPLREIEAGESLLDVITREIDDAEVVVLFSSQSANSNLWLEAGIATALKRPTVLVRCDDSHRVPSELTSPVSLGPVVTERGLALSIRRALRGRERPSVEQRHALGVRTGRVLGIDSDKWLKRLFAQSVNVESSDARSHYRNFEDWFAELLTFIGVPYERSARTATASGPMAQIDFVVTADELTGNLGAVLPIELLSSRRQKTLSSALRSRVGSFRKYLEVTGANTLLVVVMEMDDAPQLLDTWGGSVLLTSARDLVNVMRDQTFGGAVLQLRNVAVRVGEAW